MSFTPHINRGCIPQSPTILISMYPTTVNARPAGKGQQIPEIASVPPDVGSQSVATATRRPLMMAQSQTGSTFNVQRQHRVPPSYVQLSDSECKSNVPVILVRQPPRSLTLIHQSHPAIIMDPPIGVIGPIHLKLPQSVSQLETSAPSTISHSLVMPKHQRHNAARE